MSEVVRHPGGPIAPGLERVRLRRLVVEAPVVRFPLHPGDRSLVAPGEVVQVGAPLLERARAATVGRIGLDEAPGEAAPGHWWSSSGRRHPLRRGRGGPVGGELLFATADEWVVVAGDRADVVEAPIAGIVREVRPSVGIVLATQATAIPGAAAVGGPSRGRLELVAAPDGELRASAMDIRRQGAVVVAGSRVDAETLTRARAMGARGVLAGAVGSRELRDLAAGEARQRASLQPIPPFAVIALEGHVRMPIATPIAAILSALAGREVALVGEPPLILVDGPARSLPLPPAGLVRVHAGPEAGTEGRWLGLAGLRRFAAGVVLEAGFVGSPDGSTLVVPLADLERFA